MTIITLKGVANPGDKFLEVQVLKQIAEISQWENMS